MEEYFDRNGFDGKQTEWEELLNIIGLIKNWGLNIIKRELYQKD